MAEAVEKFESWVLCELMGHGRVAGMATERSIGGNNFLRVDVPDCGPDKPAFTTYVGSSAIFRLTPCTEETARQAAKQWRDRPHVVLDVIPKTPLLEGQSAWLGRERTSDDRPEWDNDDDPIGDEGDDGSDDDDEDS